MLDKQDLQAIREIVRDEVRDIVRVEVNQAIEANNEKIYAYIDRNNLAIADIITQALEGTEARVKDVEKVTKDNLYDLTLLKQKQTR